MPDLVKLAEARAEASGHTYMEWLGALEEGRFLSEEAQLGERAFLKIAGACASPQQFSFMVEALDAYAKEHPGSPNGFEMLAERVDESPYGLVDWIAALECVYRWLAARNRHAGFSGMLGYLSCSAQSVANHPIQPPLSDLVAEMLDEYGFEG